ncbi:hypothetical protein [Streptomyces shenzhenensis]|uniref:hypothetical protein n=1 Tax=Streptomyces shenzhenensis TaxID=943815 RepID=UPI0036AF2279
MAWKPEATIRAIAQECPRCGAPVIHQRHGLPLVVTADAERYPPEQAAGLTGPNRLAWCLRESPWTGLRLTEVHHRACVFSHVVDHCCPPGTPLTPKPKGALW